MCVTNDCVGLPRLGCERQLLSLGRSQLLLKVQELSQFGKNQPMLTCQANFGATLEGSPSVLVKPSDDWDSSSRETTRPQRL